MRQALRLHPDSLCLPGLSVAAEASLARPGELRLDYVLTAPISGLRIPPLAASARADELWRHTCFEAFLRAPPGQAYWEFNFTPSTEWAAYRFDSYRQGMKAARVTAAPMIAWRAEAQSGKLSATLALDELPELPRDRPWRLGLSAIIEEADGRKSYWALAHPPGAPDFHRADGFALQIEAAVRA